VANGSSHEGPARGDRIREIGAKHDRRLQVAIDEERAKSGERKLPPYRDEQDSGEITANVHGLHAKGVPREAWRWIGIGIAAFITLAGVALVVALL
jgi:hypothetical protein